MRASVFIDHHPSHLGPTASALMNSNSTLVRDLLAIARMATIAVTVSVAVVWFVMRIQKIPVGTLLAPMQATGIAALTGDSLHC